MIPQIAIVGRPNVGKSSLFNWLAGRRIAIVDPTAGVTRDRVTTLVQLGERWFELVDTGGMRFDDAAEDLTADVERQIEYALDEAAAVLFLVDARTGLTNLDELVAERLRKIDKPVACVVNKCDSPELEPHATDFDRFGYGKVIPVSAMQHRGKDELLRRIGQMLPRGDSEGEGEARAPGTVAMKLAIVGRRNTGKSTFINALARSERMIVSEIPGTTRDSVDVRFERDGKVFIAIDTAGVRKKGKDKTDVEFYSEARAERSIRRADVVLLFHDSVMSISNVDKQLAGYVLEHFKPAIFVVNKWDLLAKQLNTGEFADYLRKVYPSLDYVPIAFVTAKDNRNVHTVLNLAQNLHKQASARVSTGDLNRLLKQALDDNPPPMRMNRRAKVFFATQVAANPPTIVLFTNSPELFDNTYQRYLIKVLRDHLPFHDVPIKLHLRGKKRDDGVEMPGEVAEQRVRKRAKPVKLKEPPNGKKRGGAVLWDD
jgi:GTP-binding protein